MGIYREIFIGIIRKITPSVHNMCIIVRRMRILGYRITTFNKELYQPCRRHTGTQEKRVDFTSNLCRIHNIIIIHKIRTNRHKIRIIRHRMHISRHIIIIFNTESIHSAAPRHCGARPEAAPMLSLLNVIIQQPSATPPPCLSWFTSFDRL